MKQRNPAAPHPRAALQRRVEAKGPGGEGQVAGRVGQIARRWAGRSRGPGWGVEKGVGVLRQDVRQESQVGNAATAGFWRRC